VEYLIIERRERLTSQGKLFELLLTPSDTNSPGKRVTVSPPDWQTFALAIRLDTKVEGSGTKSCPTSPSRSKRRTERESYGDDDHPVQSPRMTVDGLKLYHTEEGVLVERGGSLFKIGSNAHPGWDALIMREDLHYHLSELIGSAHPLANRSIGDFRLKPPIGSQEVWAAGVTYFRSRDARMEESKSAGGGDFYDRVYNAERPELFFKSAPHRVVGDGAKVAIRSDAKWSVPEPELAVVVSPSGTVVGYTIGNDMSSRDIEGENPLYLPQAKVYDRSCALGPGILVTATPLPSSTQIRLEIHRAARRVFEGSTPLSSMKRNVKTLVEYLYRDNSFPNGCFLLTGTGIVPPDSFTLQHADEIRITIDGIGTLINVVG
jgi:2-dehydro-3-deoxy-D-arabinonate dehydratase